MARFANVSCSNCGRDFGPGDHGFSHCEHHRGRDVTRQQARDHADDDAESAERTRGQLDRLIDHVEGERDGANGSAFKATLDRLHAALIAIAAEHMAEVERVANFGVLAGQPVELEDA